MIFTSDTIFLLRRVWLVKLKVKNEKQIAIIVEKYLQLDCMFYSKSFNFTRSLAGLKYTLYFPGED